MDDQNNPPAGGLPTTEPTAPEEAPTTPAEQPSSTGGDVSEQPTAATEEKCPNCGNPTQNCVCPPPAPAV